MPSFDDAVFGFYALVGESVVECQPDVSKESVGEFFPNDTREKSGSADSFDLR